MSKAATGPWEVASSIPQAIYTIPASSSSHHVTYVTVVEDDDDDDDWETFVVRRGVYRAHDRMGLRGLG